MEQDGQRSGVGGEDDDLGDTAVQGLGGLVGAFLQLLVVGGLLDDVENLLAESCVGGGPGLESKSGRDLFLGREMRGTYRQIRSVLLPFLNLGQRWYF